MTDESADHRLMMLREMLAAKDAMDGRIAHHVQSLRENGYTWKQIGAAIGITAQGAYKRWGTKK